MLPCFNYLWDLFYIDKVKTIPSNIGDLLTEVGLAFWIMDDGGLGSNGTLNLHTDSYTLAEVNLLIDVLKRNFDINSRCRPRPPLRSNPPASILPKAAGRMERRKGGGEGHL